MSSFSIYSQKEVMKMNCSIGQVAKMLGISVQSLRNWEKQGIIPKPKRRPTNHREYADADIEAIKEYLKKIKVY